MAATLDIPLISGGDRHAIAPNAVVNLTAARTFAEFADEIRDGESHLVVMPEYSQPTELRKLAAAADVVRHYRNYPQERRHWTGRVSWLREDGVRPLSHILPGGGPLWLRSVITAFRFAGSPVSRALLTPVFRRRPANLDPGLLPTLS
jgi:hypothetical protein